MLVSKNALPMNRFHSTFALLSLSLSLPMPGLLFVLLPDGMLIV